LYCTVQSLAIARIYSVLRLGACIDEADVVDEEAECVTDDDCEYDPYVHGH